MPIYKNASRKSGILSYETSDNSISVTFRTGKFRTYLYNYTVPGKEHVDHMIQLAESGAGLNSYIKLYVGEQYSSKF